MGLFDGLPSGWNQAKDPQGRVYYFNRSSGETTYERPAKPDKPKKEEKAPKGGAGLPEGWAEAAAPDGSPYYYNSATGETTYTRPMAAPKAGRWCSPAR